MNKPDQFIDAEGRECFRCAVCGETFYSSPDFTEEDRLKEMDETCPPPSPEEPIRSVCDDCYKRMRNTFATAAAYINCDTVVVPQPSGQVQALTRAEAMELLGMPDYDKETSVVITDVEGAKLDLECAVVRIRQIWEEYQQCGEFRSDLMSRLATCDAPRLEKLAAKLKDGEKKTKTNQYVQVDDLPKEGSDAAPE